MAAETPFGLSFGDPRRYMGQSPLAEIGKAAKTLLTGYAIQESGLEKWLNDKGMKKNKQGGYEYSAPAGSIPPITSGSTGVNADGVWGVNPMRKSPMSLGQPAVPVSPSAPAADTSATPADIGEQILDGKWDGFQAAPTAPVSVTNPTDFNPLAPDTSNQFAVSGNDYQQVPGYGKLQKIAGQLFGMG